MRLDSDELRWRARPSTWTASSPPYSTARSGVSSDVSNFAFLGAEWPQLQEAASRAEALARPDPRAACFYARRALEVAVEWLYRHDRSLRLPYQDQLSALIHEPSFRTLVGQALFGKARVIKDLGNQAVHSNRAVTEPDSLTAVRELFHFCFWLARTYAHGTRPADAMAFDASLLPSGSGIAASTAAKMLELAKAVDARDRQLAELVSGRATLDAELQRLRAEIAAVKAANEATPDAHDYSEDETRDFFIDLLLREAGWPLDQPRDREYEVAGMPTDGGKGFVDYVLWGDDGLPLALVEAKRTKRDARAGRQQAKLYADCLEQQSGRRPIIFYSNGYEHWLWDDVRYAPRAVQGFLKKDELELAIQRRTTRLSLVEAEIDTAIVERYYQIRAIRRIAETFDVDNERKALIVMATGAGKTRTVIALADLLMRCNWAKRILFLADRVALVRQATNAFKQHLPSASPVNLISEKDAEGRVYISTYPTMMRLIDESKGDQRRFGAGHFDLVIIDEAHRSVYQKYRAIFEYFDSLLVGLTATPKDEIDRNTYGLFDLETGVPTDAYDLTEAVKDGYLVPPRAVSVPLAFQRGGIKYDDLSEEEKEEWDALEWSDDGSVPAQVDPAALNSWLFNADTVDKVLEHLMTRGLRVTGGDRLGKTIVFAKNHEHAEFIAERFDANYPHYKGSFARVIDFKVEYAQSLIDDFSMPDMAPHIAISVDMLDTGIDVPEVVNLVFFKIVRSKTKFWQMVGRGTRLRPDLFGPGQDKEFFYIFDYCQNLEYFSQSPPTTEGATGQTLSRRLFTGRLELIAAIERRQSEASQGEPQVAETRVRYGDPRTDDDVRQELIELLHGQVAAMNLDNFVVRPQRRLVEKFARPESWLLLQPEDYEALSHEVAGLPTGLTEEDEEAKRFDLLTLRIELAVLRGDRSFQRLRDQVREIAAILESQSSIPAIREHLELIQDIQAIEYWQDITVPMLEIIRKRLRGLIKLIEKSKRQLIYTDFEDVMGEEVNVDLPGFSTGLDYARFQDKARRFLREHMEQAAIRKLQRNEPLSPVDLEELQRIMVSAGVGTFEDIERARRESSGLGLFIRSLIGLDREAAKQEFADFLSDRSAAANQIEFVNLIIDHLTEHGVMDPGLLYESPFTDVSPRGPDGIFTPDEVEKMVEILREIRLLATAE
jgi:type I restriction enzyme R subunit